MMTVLNIDTLIRRHLVNCNVPIQDGHDVEADLATAIDAVCVDTNWRSCANWLQQELGISNRTAFSRELLRIYHAYGHCLARNMACHISDSILSTLLRQQNWREYVVCTLCGLAFYERPPVEFHPEDTVDAFVQAKNQYGVLTWERRHGTTIDIPPESLETMV